MNRFNAILAIALMLQVALGLASWGRQHQAAAPSKLVFGFPSSDVQSIDLIDGDQRHAPVRLERKDSGWVIATSADFPADPTKVEQMLGRILEMRVREPITTSTDSHRPLRVAEDRFDRMVALTVPQGTTEVFMGASGRSSNVRLNGRPEVWSVPKLSPRNIGLMAKDYAPTELLRVTPDELASLEIRNANGTFRFERGPERWLLTEPPGQIPDDERLEALFEHALSVDLADLPASDAALAAPVDPVAVVTVHRNAGAPPIEYVVGQKNEGRAPVRRSDQKYTVLVYDLEVEAVVTIDLDGIIAPPLPAFQDGEL